MTEPGVDDVAEEGGQAVLPRSDLARRDPGLEPRPGAFGEHGVQLASPGIDEQAVGALPKESHRFPTWARVVHVRVGATTRDREGSRLAPVGPR